MIEPEYACHWDVCHARAEQVMYDNEDKPHDLCTSHAKYSRKLGWWPYARNLQSLPIPLGRRTSSIRR